MLPVRRPDRRIALLSKLTVAGLILGVSAATVIATTEPSVADPSAGAGTTYYVSTKGSDSASGKSIGRAFRHIQACADVMVAGDTCEILAGTYPETVTPAHSGTAGAPITYRAYHGATVTVTGADRVTGWTPVTSDDVAEIAKTDSYAADSAFSDAVAAGTVYQADIDLGDDASDVQIFTGDQMAVETQWPYPGTDPLHPSTIMLAGVGSVTDVIEDADLTRPAGYWTGGRVQTSYWYVTATASITDSAVGSVTMDAAPPCIHKLQAGETRYSLSGQIGELSHPGEWFYDAATKKLYLDGEHSPDRQRIRAKKRTYGFDLDQISHTTVRGVSLFATTIRTGDTSTGDVLDDLDGRYLSHYTDITRGETACGSTVNRGVGDSGLVIKGTGNVVSHSRLSLSAGNGIALRGEGNTATDNVISDVDYEGTYAAGIAVQGTGQTVTHNTISDVGRSGINLQWTGGTAISAPDKIAYNDISGYATLSLDTAAIYSCCGSNMNQSSIDHNVLHDPTPIRNGQQFAQSGIYADNGQNNLVITDNVGWNNPNYTVTLNGLGGCSCNIGLYNNTGGIYMMYVKGADQSTGTKVINNIGQIVGDEDATDGGMVFSHNLRGDTDPLFTDADHHDYTLSADSPARNAGVVIDGVTDGYTDSAPSLGAYQYGAQRWTAGARR